MTLEEFEKATEEDLRAEANACLAKAAQAGGGDKPHLYLEAQFYMSEMNRRQDTKIVRRDFILELVIIALIIVEILLAIEGIRVGIKEGTEQARLMGKQTDILSNLKDSFSAALDASIEASRNDQRAWVGIKSMDVTLLETDKPLKTEVKIINTGKTIALDLYYPGAVQTSWVPLDIEKFERSKNMPPATAPMRAGVLFQNIEVNIPAETSVPLNSQQVEAIKARRLLVYLFGEIHYKDIFRRPHTTQYCGVYVPGTRRFEDCTQHTSVD